MTHIDIHIMIEGSHFLVGIKGCMRGYSKHFSSGNSLLPVKKSSVPVMKTEKKKKKKKKKKDTVLPSRAIQALVGLLFLR